MSFRPLEQRIAIASVKPASIRLVRRAQASRPTCLISLRSVLAAQLKWKKGERCAAQVGEGDDAGKLRIVRNGKPAIAEFRELKGGYMFDLGFIASLNDGKESDLIPIDAAIIDADTVELLLPDWGRLGESAEEEDSEAIEQPSAAPPAARGHAPIAAAPKQIAAASRDTGKHEPPIVHNGVTIVFAPDAESVSYRGKSMEVTARQAQLVALLARAMPNSVGREFIKPRLFGGKIGPHADGVLDTMAMDLGKALGAIGLVLRNTKGIGFALQVKA